MKISLGLFLACWLAVPVFSAETPAAPALFFASTTNKGNQTLNSEAGNVTVDPDSHNLRIGDGVTTNRVQSVIQNLDKGGNGLQISDIPRDTQMGKPPAPEGAPGNGRYFPPVPAHAELPTIWLIGDSTVRNGTLGDGSNLNQWGWGAPIIAYFDTDKVNVVNRAFGGTSSRSFYTGFFWQNLQPQIKKGDFVILQFGANDNGGASGKGALKGVGPETEDITRNGKTETVHTFGWYLTQFVKETRAQGATPIICSLTPRKNWTSDNHFRRDNTTHAAWAAEVAKTTGTPFVDLYELIARKYESLGKEKVIPLYVPTPKENLHTGWDGAIINAECVIAGLKGLKDDPLAPYFSTRAKDVAPVAIDSAEPRK